jgi:hypothetical protein
MTSCGQSKRGSIARCRVTAISCWMSPAPCSPALQISSVKRRKRWFSSNPARISSLQSTIPVSGRRLRRGGRSPPSCGASRNCCSVCVCSLSAGSSALKCSCAIALMARVCPIYLAVEVTPSWRAPHLGSLGGRVSPGSAVMVGREFADSEPNQNGRKNVVPTRRPTTYKCTSQRL